MVIDTDICITAITTLMVVFTVSTNNPVVKQHTLTTHLLFPHTPVVQHAACVLSCCVVYRRIITINFYSSWYVQPLQGPVKSSILFMFRICVIQDTIDVLEGEVKVLLYVLVLVELTQVTIMG